MKINMVLIPFFYRNQPFATINTHSIFGKFQIIDICSMINKWFTSYLRNHKLQFKIKHLVVLYKSTPQGIILGLLMFIFIIIDLAKCVMEGKFFIYSHNNNSWYISRQQLFIRINNLLKKYSDKNLNFIEHFINVYA